VATPRAALVALAYAKEDVVEAIEGRGDGFVLGVQWHPETLEGDHARALIRACERTSEQGG